MRVDKHNIITVPSYSTLSHSYIFQPNNTYLAIKIDKFCKNESRGSKMGITKKCISTYLPTVLISE